MTHGTEYFDRDRVPRVARNRARGDPDLPFQMPAEAWHRTETPAGLAEETIMFLYDDVTEEESIEGYQMLIDSGDAWRLEGSVGRAAMDMIRNGQCMLGEEGHTDYYGNYVPSRTEVEAGTKGSPEFVEAARLSA